MNHQEQQQQPREDNPSIMPEPVSASDVPHDHYDSSSSENDEWKTHRINPSDSEDDDVDDNDNTNATDSRKYNIPKKDELYNPNEDEETNAFVYQHLRGGMEETIAIRRKNQSSDSSPSSRQNNSSNGHGEDLDETMQDLTGTGNDTTTTNTTTVGERRKDKDQVHTLQQAKLLKPRSSDAVLSCPCCFQIVCMDCQRHEQYSNQFRAMFVMNIGVRWDKFIPPEGSSSSSNGNPTSSDVGVGENSTSGEEIHQVKKYRQEEANGSSQPPVSIPISQHEDGESHNVHDSKQEMYHSVHCNSCHTEVAALDMTDEVYYFFGCLVSAW